MDPPTPTPSPPAQLELPLTFPASSGSGEPSSPVLLPVQVWSQLPLPLRARCHQTLVQILQEVLHDAGPS